MRGGICGMGGAGGARRRRRRCRKQRGRGRGKMWCGECSCGRMESAGGTLVCAVCEAGDCAVGVIVWLMKCRFEMDEEGLLGQVPGFRIYLVLSPAIGVRFLWYCMGM